MQSITNDVTRMQSIYSIETYDMEKSKIIK